MTEHNVLLKGVIRVSNVLTTKLDPADLRDREKLEEQFAAHLTEISRGLSTEHTLFKVNRYDTSVEEIPNSLS